jgi:hypothetical protein
MFQAMMDKSIHKGRAATKTVNLEKGNIHESRHQSRKHDPAAVGPLCGTDEPGCEWDPCQWMVSVGQEETL